MPTDLPGEDPYESLSPLVGGELLELQRTGAGTPARVHLDLETDDVAAEVARVVGLGATVLEEHEGYTILTDPGGMVFCVVPVQTATTSSATRRPGRPRDRHRRAGGSHRRDRAARRVLLRVRPHRDAGLARRDDATYVGAFQGIDQAVYNPWFMSTFMGTPLLVVAALVLHLDEDTATLACWSRRCSCAVGTVVVTAAVHLPLNRRSRRSTVDGSATRVPPGSRFEERWVRWNVARTATSVGAFVLIAVELARAG